MRIGDGDGDGGRGVWVAVGSMNSGIEARKSTWDLYVTGSDHAKLVNPQHIIPLPPAHSPYLQQPATVTLTPLDSTTCLIPRPHCYNAITDPPLRSGCCCSVGRRKRRNSRTGAFAHKSQTKTRRLGDFRLGTRTRRKERNKIAELAGGFEIETPCQDIELHHVDKCMLLPISFPHTLFRASGVLFSAS